MVGAETMHFLSKNMCWHFFISDLALFLQKKKVTGSIEEALEESKQNGN